MLFAPGEQAAPSHGQLVKEVDAHSRQDHAGEGSNIAEENRKEDRKSDCASLHRFIHLLPALLPSADSFWKNGPVKQANHPSVKCTYKEE